MAEFSWQGLVISSLAVLPLLVALSWYFYRRFQHSRQHFSRLFQALPTPSWLLDHGRIVEANPAFLRLLGAHDASLVLHQAVEIFAPSAQRNGEASATFFHRHLLAAQEGQTQEFEWLLHTVHQQEIVVRLRLEPIIFDGHTLVLCAAEDLSERLRMEALLANSERQFHLFFEKSNNIMLLVRPDSGAILRANQAAVSFYGYSREHLQKMNIAQINTASPEVLAYDRNLAVQEKRSYFSFQHKLASGELRDVDVHASPLMFDGEPMIFSFIVDATERRRVEKRLNLAASVFTHARESIVITDPNGHIIDVNQAFVNTTGYAREEILGKTPSVLRSGRHSPDFYRELWASIQTKGYWFGEIWNRKKNGEIFIVSSSISCVKNVHGKVQNFVSIFSDITQIKDQKRQLEHMAHYDVLTGLPNRVLMGELLAKMMIDVVQQNHFLVLAYLDLDGFKAINERYGHHFGDQLLLAMTERMKKILHEKDVLARLGGDEFILISPHMRDIAHTREFLDSLLKSLSAPIAIGGKSLQLTTSLGVTFYPQDHADADQLLRHADQAMYRAKQLGRNRYEFFDIEHESAEVERAELLEEIDRGIDNDEFVLHFQPQVNMRRGDVMGAEALIRWQHPQKGLMFPGQFLGVVENHCLGVKLGEWVLESAMKQMREWNYTGMDFQISVNLTAQHLQQADFVNKLEALLSRYPELPPNRLELEILETSALDDLDHISSIIRRCRALGVSFAIDDFGTGYSSLSYLRHLPANLLKIDQSFVRDMLHDPDDLAIVNGVLNLAHTFRKHVIAEGVETVMHGRLLLSLGCEYAQGYGVARPMPADKMPEWVKNWQSLPEWRNASEYIYGPHHLPLIFALVEHRAWLRMVFELLDGESETVPELDSRCCRFGRWCENQGRALFGHLASFQTLDERHQALHNSAAALLQHLHVDCCDADHAVPSSKISEEDVQAFRAQIERDSDHLQLMLWDLLDGKTDMKV